MLINRLIGLLIVWLFIHLFIERLCSLEVKVSYLTFIAASKDEICFDMNRIPQYIFSSILTIVFFSLWAGFALLVVNQNFHTKLPGYRIGKLCIWELVAFFIAAWIAKSLISKWGNIEVENQKGNRRVVLHYNYAKLFAIYFLISIFVSVWQFYVFSQSF